MTYNGVVILKVTAWLSPSVAPHRLPHRLGAGTPDIVGPGSGINWNVMRHSTEDVEPFKWALELDGDKSSIDENGHYFKLYISVRPPNPGKNCPKNP